MLGEQYADVDRRDTNPEPAPDGRRTGGDDRAPNGTDMTPVIIRIYLFRTVVEVFGPFGMDVKWHVKNSTAVSAIKQRTGKTRFMHVRRRVRRHA